MSKALGFRRRVDILEKALMPAPKREPELPAWKIKMWEEMTDPQRQLFIEAGTMLREHLEEAKEWMKNPDNFNSQLYRNAMCFYARQQPNPLIEVARMLMSKEEHELIERAGDLSSMLNRKYKPSS